MHGSPKAGSAQCGSTPRSGHVPMMQGDDIAHEQARPSAGMWPGLLSPLPSLPSASSTGHHHLPPLPLFPHQTLAKHRSRPNDPFSIFIPSIFPFVIFPRGFVPCCCSFAPHCHSRPSLRAPSTGFLARGSWGGQVGQAQEHQVAAWAHPCQQ
jgi:hypothetical protein